MKTKKSGFTLIELVLVIFILLILMAILLPKLQNLREKGLRASCAGNLKTLTQAISIYSSLEASGNYPVTPTADNVESLYGALFQKNGWNALQNLICPSNADGVQPTSSGFGKPLGSNGTIDYWIVFGGNLNGPKLSPANSEGDNVLIIEKFSGANGGSGLWDNTDYHRQGGNVSRVNGNVEFLSDFPSNVDSSGTVVNINSANCSK